MGIHVRIRKGRLYLDILERGKPRRWEKLGLSVPDDPALKREVLRLADSIRIRREMQLAAAREGLLDPVAGKESLLSYAKGLEASGALSQLKYSIRALERYGKAAIPIAAVDERWLESYRTWLSKESGFSPGTAATHYLRLKSVLKRAVRDRILPRDPGAGVRSLRRPESARLPLTPEEVRKLAETPLGSEIGELVRRAFLFSVQTGLRISDLASLRWGDIQRGENPRILRKTKKTGAVIAVPLTASALKLISGDRIHKGEEPVFPGLNTGTRTYYFKRWAKLAGLDRPLSWHDARRTFATLAVEGGASLYAVQGLLGHTNSKMTQVYAKVTDKLARSAVESLPEVNLADGEGTK